MKRDIKGLNLNEFKNLRYLTFSLLLPDLYDQHLYNCFNNNTLIIEALVKYWFLEFGWSKNAGQGFR